MLVWRTVGGAETHCPFGSLCRKKALGYSRIRVKHAETGRERHFHSTWEYQVVSGDPPITLRDIGHIFLKN